MRFSVGLDRTPRGSSVADTSVEGAVSGLADFATGVWGPYWSDISTGVIIFLDDGDDIAFARTTDKGANWATTEIDVGDTQQIAAWYDKETPGNSGTLVHITWMDSFDGGTNPGTVYYRTLDVADGSLGTQQTVDSTATINSNTFSQRCAITQAVNGDIVVAFSHTGTTSGVQCYKSSDNFATAGTNTADVYETASEEDWLLLFPADVDAGDVAGVFWDRSSDEITIKMFDSSADGGNGTWTEFATPIATSQFDDSVHINMDGSVLLSDNTIYLTWHSNDDSAGDILQTAVLTVDSISAPSSAVASPVFSGQPESAQVGILIDQNNNDVYVSHLKGGGFWQSTMNLVYHKSTDSMGSWGAEQAYSEATADDLRTCSAGRIASTDGGRFQPAFFNSDLSEIFVNEVNDVELAAGGPPATLISSRRLLSGLGR